MTERKIALVTGASSGFGRVIARRLHHREYRVFGTSRSKDAVADPGVEMLTLDVRSQDSVQVCVRTVLDSEGRIDVLVNNAGTTHLSLPKRPTSTKRGRSSRPISSESPDDERVLPAMRARKSGRIITSARSQGLSPYRDRLSIRRASLRWRATARLSATRSSRSVSMSHLSSRGSTGRA